VSVFETLNKVDVSAHIDTKGGFKYLSWSWAWAEVSRNFITTRKVYCDKNDNNYHTDGKYCWVEVGVTIEGLEHIEMLPVMDFKNKSVPLEKVDSMAVNKAIQRATVKAIALHGLGLNLYAGEDLPMTPSTITASQIDHIQSLCSDAILKWALGQWRMATIADLQIQSFDKFEMFITKSVKESLLRWIADYHTKNNSPKPYIENSVKKHLGVENIISCNDINKLREYKQHLSEKAKEVKDGKVD